MPTPMITNEWPRFVLPIIRKEWIQKLNAVVSPALGLFGVQSSKQSVEYSVGIGDFGIIPEYNSASAEGAGAAIAYENFSPLFETTFTHKEYARGVAIERKLFDDNQSGLILRRAQSLGHAFGTTRAVHASSLFNNSFSSSYVGGDSVALCATTHDISPTDGTHVSNLGTSALAYDAVVATLLAGANLDDSKGYPMPSIYDILYVPTALQDEAVTIVKSVGKPGGANNDVNFVATQGLTVVVDPYLTSATDWWMIDSAQMKMHALWFNRVLPEISLDPSSDFNLVAKYRGYMRYSFGWDDFRFIYGHNT